MQMLKYADVIGLVVSVTECQGIANRDNYKREILLLDTRYDTITYFCVFTKFEILYELYYFF